MKVGFVHDAVAVKDGPRRVPRQLHGHPFGHPGPHEITRRRPATIVEQPSGDPRLPTRRRPRATPRPDRHLVATEDLRVPCTTSSCSPCQSRNSSAGTFVGPEKVSTSRSRRTATQRQREGSRHGSARGWRRESRPDAIYSAGTRAVSSSDNRCPGVGTRRWSSFGPVLDENDLRQGWHVGAAGLQRLSSLVASLPL